MTDKTLYTVDVPGNEVEIQFQPRQPKGYKRVRWSRSPGQPVKLRLRGLHEHDRLARSSATGQELADFCAFYSLLDTAPKASSG